MTRKQPDPRTPHAADQNGLVDEELTREVIGGYYKAYNTLGYGFRESVYAKALYIELRKRGLRVEREQVFFVHFGPRPTFNRVISDKKPSRGPAVSAESASSQLKKKGSLPPRCVQRPVKQTVKLLSASRSARNLGGRPRAAPDDMASEHLRPPAGLPGHPETRNNPRRSLPRSRPQTPQ